MERLDTDPLFRWFCDMDPAEAVFDPMAFTHNRRRLEQSGIAAKFFELVVKRAVDAGLTSHEHFSVDGTLIESYASLKSFRPKDESGDDSGDGNPFKPRNAEVDFHGEKRSNATHRSTTDGEARLYRKSAGTPALLYHMGHAITENRHGLIMAVTVTEASGDAEPAAAEALVDELHERLGIPVKMLGADKNYDSDPHLLELERRRVTPHVAMRSGPVGGEKQTTRRQRKNRSGIAARQRMADRLREVGYTLSQRCRKKIEEGFGWLKTVAGLPVHDWSGGGKSGNKCTWPPQHTTWCE